MYICLCGEDVKNNKQISNIQGRGSNQRAIEPIIIENKWATKRNIHFNRADKPSDFQTYKGRSLFKYGEPESSDGEDVLSEFSDFSDDSDDALPDNVSNYEQEQEILNDKLEFLQHENIKLNNTYDKYIAMKHSIILFGTIHLNLLQLNT